MLPNPQSSILNPHATCHMPQFYGFSGSVLVFLHYWQFHSRLSTTSSLYSSGGWNWERRDPAISYYHKVEEQIIHFQFLFIILSFQHLLFQSVPLANTAKAKLSRTTKSSPITNLNNYKASLLNTKSNSDREERQVKSIKKTLSEKLSNLRVYK